MGMTQYRVQEDNEVEHLIVFTDSEWDGNLAFASHREVLSRMVRAERARFEVSDGESFHVLWSRMPVKQI